MIYTTTYHAHRKALGIKGDEYTMLHAVMLLQNLEKNGFWCVAPNEYFTTFMDAETIRGVQKIAKRLVDKGLLIKGAGTKKRVSDEFVIGFNKFSKVQIGLHEQSSPMNIVHPKHEQSSPLTMNSVHVYHEQSSPNIERIEKDNKKIVKEQLPFSSAKFKTAWQEWVQHRKEKRKAITPTAQKKQLAYLATLGEERAIVALNYSIQQGWEGIYEPKANKSDTVDWALVNQTGL